MAKCSKCGKWPQCSDRLTMRWEVVYVPWHGDTLDECAGDIEYGYDEEHAAAEWAEGCDYQGAITRLGNVTVHVRKSPTEGVYTTQRKAIKVAVKRTVIYATCVAKGEEVSRG